VTPEGLVVLAYDLPLGAHIDLSLASLSLELEGDGVTRLTMSGKLAVKQRHLEAKGNCSEYVQKTVANCQAVLNGCGFSWLHAAK
jgi:hypothetical protein